MAKKGEIKVGSKIKFNKSPFAEDDEIGQARLGMVATVLDIIPAKYDDTIRFHFEEEPEEELAKRVLSFGGYVVGSGSCDLVD